MFLLFGGSLISNNIIIYPRRMVSLVKSYLSILFSLQFAELKLLGYKGFAVAFCGGKTQLVGLTLLLLLSLPAF